MRKIDDFTQAEIEAENLLSELGINSLPIDPFDIARQLGIELMPMPSVPNGASGMFLHVNGECGIGYPTHVDNNGFVRFSVAHEIGHYRLPGHPEAVVDEKGKHHSCAGASNGDRYEKEADSFAAALLMPTGLFTTAMRHAGEGLAAIEKLGELCGTSIEATAIRYKDCTFEPFAVIRSEGDTIEYASMSSALREFPKLTWIKKGTRLPADTLTAQFNRDSSRVQAAEKDSDTCDLDTWFGGCSQEITEEVIGLGEYGKTLTILREMVNPDEDEDDSELGAWNPTFR